MPKDARRMAVNFAKLPVFYNPRGEAFAFAKEVAAQPRCDPPRGQTAPLALAAEEHQHAILLAETDEQRH